MDELIDFTAVKYFLQRKNDNDKLCIKKWWKKIYISFFGQSQDGRHVDAPLVRSCVSAQCFFYNVINRNLGCGFPVCSDGSRAANTPPKRPGRYPWKLPWWWFPGVLRCRTHHRNHPDDINENCLGCGFLVCSDSSRAANAPLKPLGQYPWKRDKPFSVAAADDNVKKHFKQKKKNKQTHEDTAICGKAGWTPAD